MGIRLLPLIVIASLLLLGLKMSEMFEQGKNVADLLFVAETRAKEEAESKKEPEKTDENKTEVSAENPEAASKEKSDHEPSEHTVKANPGAKEAENTPENTKDIKNEVPQCSPKELELLQNLTKRREELDARERDITLQASVLKAAAAKMEERVSELKKLEEQANLILKEYQKKEDEKIKNLVRIYENMKPKDAANILEKMDMPVLLEITSHMKEAKAAAILAKMDPKNAKDITTQLSGMRRLPAPDNSYKN